MKKRPQGYFKIKLHEISVLSIVWGIASLRFRKWQRKEFEFVLCGIVALRFVLFNRWTCVFHLMWSLMWLTHFCCYDSKRAPIVHDNSFEAQLQVETVQGIVTGRAAQESEDERMCVICLSIERDTTVLPCRHMCMCHECAQELRKQTSKCPICRNHVESLLHIRMVRLDSMVSTHHDSQASNYWQTAGLWPSSYSVHMPEDRWSTESWVPILKHVTGLEDMSKLPSSSVYRIPSTVVADKSYSDYSKFEVCARSYTFRFSDWRIQLVLNFLLPVELY